MECTHVKNWILEADDRADAPPEVAAHLGECDECRRSVDQLDMLENAWRQAPVIDNAEACKATFLSSLANREGHRHLIRTRAVSQQTWRRLALAASVFLAVGLGAWVVTSDRRAEASSDVLDSLVDWNLSLTEASPADRKKVYDRDSHELRTSVAQSHLQGAEAELAATLLSTAESMATSDNVLAHLDGFRDMADRLAELIELSIERGDLKRAELLARQYRRVTTLGLTLNLQRAEASGALHLDRPGKLEKVILEDVGQAQALSRLLENSPNLTRTEIRSALGVRKEHANRKRIVPQEN